MVSLLPIDSQASQADVRSAFHPITSSPRPRNFPRLVKHAIVVLLAFRLVSTTSFAFYPQSTGTRASLLFDKSSTDTLSGTVHVPAVDWHYLGGPHFVIYYCTSSLACPWTVCSTGTGNLLSTHNNPNSTTLNTAEGERKLPIRGACARQDFRCTYSRDPSISCQPIL